MPAAPPTEPVTTGWKAVGGFFRVFDIAFFLPGAVLVLGLLLSHGATSKAVVGNVLDILGAGKSPLVEQVIPPPGPEARSDEEQGRGVAGVHAEPPAPTAEKEDEDVPGWLAALALAVSLVVLVFVSGLLCHVVARVWRSLMFRLGAWQWSRGGAGDSWFRHPYWGTTKALFSLKQASRDGWGEHVYGSAPATREREDPELLLYFWNMATLCWNVAAAFVLVAVLLLTNPSPWPVRALLSLVAALLLAMLGSEFRYFWEKERRKPPDSLGESV